MKTKSYNQIDEQVNRIFAAINPTFSGLHIVEPQKAARLRKVFTIRERYSRNFANALGLSFSTSEREIEDMKQTPLPTSIYAKIIPIGKTE